MIWCFVRSDDFQPLFIGFKQAQMQYHCFKKVPAGISICDWCNVFKNA